MQDDDTLPFPEEYYRTILTNKDYATVSYESLSSEIALAYNRSKAEPTGDPMLDSKINFDKYKANIKLAEMAIIVGDASVENDQKKAYDCYKQAQQFFQLANFQLAKDVPVYGYESDLPQKLKGVNEKLYEVVEKLNGKLQTEKILNFDSAFKLVSENPGERPKDFLGMKVTAGSKPDRSIEKYDFYSKMSVSPFKRARSKTALRFFLLKSRLKGNLASTLKATVPLVFLPIISLAALILSRGDIHQLEGTTKSAYDNIVKPFGELFTDLLLLASVALSVFVVPAETAYGRFFEHKLNLKHYYFENLSEYLGKDAYKSLSLNNAPDQEEQMLSGIEDKRFSKQDLTVLHGSESFKGLSLHEFNKVFITIITDSYGEEGQPKTERAHAMLRKMDAIKNSGGDTDKAHNFEVQSDRNLANPGSYDKKTLRSMVGDMKAELSKNIDSQRELLQSKDLSNGNHPRRLTNDELEKYQIFNNTSSNGITPSAKLSEVSTSVRDLSSNAADQREKIASQAPPVGGENPTPGKNPENR